MKKLVFFSFLLFGCVKSRVNEFSSVNNVYSNQTNVGLNLKLYHNNEEDLNLRIESMKEVNRFVDNTKSTSPLFQNILWDSIVIAFDDKKKFTYSKGDLTLPYKSFTTDNSYSKSQESNKLTYRYAIDTVHYNMAK